MIVAAIILCFVFVTQGNNFVSKLGEARMTKQASEASVAKLESRLAKLHEYKKEEGQSIIVAYQTFFNNALAISNSVGGDLLVKNKNGDPDKDIRFAVKPSDYEGVSSLELEVSVNNLSSERAAMSTFMAFTELSRALPVKILSFTEEKNYIVFNVLVYGI